MEFWSAGLGKRTMVLGLSKAEYKVEGGEEILTGVVDAPVDWNYTVRMEKGDWVRILEIATSSQVAQFLARSAGVGLILRMGVLISKLLVLLAVFGITKGGKGKKDGEELRPGEEVTPK